MNQRLQQRSKNQPLNRNTQSNGTWKSGVLIPSMASSLMLLAAFPPLNWSWLGWIAPMGWLVVCQRAAPVGRSGYWALWISGCLFWLVTLHSVRLAFWALYAGWIAMSFYLALYLPIFVATTRVMVHGWRFPLVLAAPITWTGLEMIRSYLMTGYAANTLAHSQAFQPMVIQVVDQLGTGGLGFLIMMLSAALLKSLLRINSGRKVHALVPAATAVLVAVTVAGYGRWRLNQADRLAAQETPLLRCLLLQENTPSIFEMSPNLEEYFERTESYWTKYLNLCRESVRQHGAVDLVVWPESTFTATSPYIEMKLDEDRLPDELQAEMKMHGMSVGELQDRLTHSMAFFDAKARVSLLAARGLEVNSTWNGQTEAPHDSSNGDAVPGPPGPQLLVGCDCVQYHTEEIRRFNAAIWIGSDGSVQDYYAKMHLVMFGEYIPLRPLLSWLGELFSFAGVRPGTQPKSFPIHHAWVSPSICFESMLPRLIRWQVKELRRQNKPPDVLINLTNDSWFRGTMMLDHHLASSILCSVENRLPMLVAANTGLSAEIDGSGRVLQKADRFTAKALVAQPKRDGRWGLVQTMGYPLSWLCMTLTLAVAMAPVAGWLRSTRKSND